MILFLTKETGRQHIYRTNLNQKNITPFGNNDTSFGRDGTLPFGVYQIAL